MYQRFDKEYYYHEGQYQGMKFINLIQNNYKEFFKERDVEVGFRKAFKGNWGAEAHTKRSVVQDLNRLSFNSALFSAGKLIYLWMQVLRWLDHVYFMVLSGVLLTFWILRMVVTLDYINI